MLITQLGCGLDHMIPSQARIGSRGDRGAQTWLVSGSSRCPWALPLVGWQPLGRRDQ
jgi:hypothetical protein